VHGDIYLSQGSVSTLLAYGGMFNNHIIENFQQNVRVKTF